MTRPNLLEVRLGEVMFRKKIVKKSIIVSSEEHSHLFCSVNKIYITRISIKNIVYNIILANRILNMFTL